MKNIDDELTKLKSKDFNFDEYIELGHVCLDHGHYDKALELYSAIDKQNLSKDQKAIVAFEVGQVLTFYNQNHEAIISFNNSLKELLMVKDCVPLKALNHYNLFTLCNNQHECQKHAKEALKYFNLIIDEGQGDMSQREAYEYIAEIYTRSEKFNKALLAYEKALELTGNNEEKLPILTGIAVVHGKMKNYDEAEKYFKNVLEISKDNNNVPMSKIFFDMGIAAYENDHFREAGKYLSEALRLKDNTAFLKVNSEYETNIHWYLADTAYKLGDDASLINHLSILEKNMNEENLYYANVMLMFGHYYCKIHDYTKARDYYNRVIALNTSSKEEIKMAKDCLKRLPLHS